MTGDRRYLCSELVTVLYENGSQGIAKLTANLEEIAANTAELLTEQPLEPGTALSFSAKDHDLFGVVQLSSFDPVLGWFVRVKLDNDSRWSGQRFVPQHFLPLSSPATAGPEEHVPTRSR